MFFFKLASLLPLGVLYLLGDFLYFLAFYIFRYRKKIVWQNLRDSFPEKSGEELQAIQKKFYRHLGEVFAEIIKSISISESELNRRFTVVHIDRLSQRVSEGRTVIILTTHLFNWEWPSLITSLKQPYQVYFVYQTLSSPFFDKLMLRIRTSFGGKAIKRQHVLKEVLAHHKKARIVALLADQSPAGNEKDHWTSFLNQQTAFFAGAEKMATKLKLPVFFGGVKRLQRGYYELYFKEIYHPNQPEKNKITEYYVRELENQIRETPENWLWSHKRWKKKKNF